MNITQCVIKTKTKINFCIGMYIKVVDKSILTTYWTFLPLLPTKKKKIQQGNLSQWKAAIKLHIIVFVFFQKYLYFKQFMIHQQCKNLMMQNIKIAYRPQTFGHIVLFISSPGYLAKKIYWTFHYTSFLFQINAVVLNFLFLKNVLSFPKKSIK